jgi:hypothetical protein
MGLDGEQHSDISAEMNYGKLLDDVASAKHFALAITISTT